MAQIVVPLTTTSESFGPVLTIRVIGGVNK